MDFTPFVSQIFDWKLLIYVILSYGVAALVNYYRKPKTVIPYIVATAFIWVIVIFKSL